MITGEICFKAGILFLSEKIEEMITDNATIRDIEEMINNIRNKVKNKQEKILEII